MLVKRIVAILKRFRPSKRGEFASVSPLLAITPIVAHFKSAKLRWRFISRPGAGLKRARLSLVGADMRAVPAGDLLWQLPRPCNTNMGFFTSFVLPMVLGSLLAVICSLIFISQPVGATHGYGGTTHPHDLTSPGELRSGCLDRLHSDKE